MKTRLHIGEPILSRVVERLAAAAGMDADSLDAGRMQWAIEARCRHLGLGSGEVYLERLDREAGETDELIDFLVIQETRFFRDPEVFEHIGKWAPRMLTEFGTPLRILSAPCSTGQEAYSLAGTLHHAGVPLESFTIDAFDISLTALSAARRGVYHENALKDVPEELQAACGVFRNHHWRMHDDLRNAIRFERRNLAEAGMLEGMSYHLILCRNLFIYFHAEARAVLARALALALAPGGRLVLGSADRVPEVAKFFASVKPAASFAFVHAPAKGKTHASPPRLSQAESSAHGQGGARNIPQGLKPTTLGSLNGTAKSVPFQDPVQDSPHDSLHANSSKKGAASDAAVDYYRRALESHEQGNDRQAERRCRQALYLAPGYLAALELLDTLWRRHPNLRLRRALSARIHRVRREADGLTSAHEREKA